MHKLISFEDAQKLKTVLMTLCEEELPTAQSIHEAIYILSTALIALESNES
jgi:hypothetical protein